MIEATKAFNLERLQDHPSVILLSAKNENRLQRVRKYLIDNGIQHVHFYEPDLDDDLTALATEPIYSDRRALFQKYQLVKQPEPYREEDRYVLKYPEGYWAHRGDCSWSSEYTCLEHADVVESGAWHPKAEAIPVKVRYYLQKGGVA